VFWLPTDGEALTDPDTRHASLFRARGARRARMFGQSSMSSKFGRADDAEGFGSDFDVGGKRAVDFEVEGDVECLSGVDVESAHTQPV
jgi:hypothetical protein